MIDPATHQDEQAFRRFSRSLEILRRDTWIVAGSTVVFWLTVFSLPSSHPPDFILYLMGVGVVAYFYFGLSVIFRMRSVARRMGKSWRAIIFYQLGAFLLFNLGGPFFFSLLLLREADGMLEAGQISAETVLRPRSRWAGWVASLVVAGVLISLLAVISLPGMMTARAVARQRQGRELVEQGRFQEATILLQRLLKGSPNQTEAYLSLGESLYGEHRLDEAAQALEQYLRRAEEANRYFASSNLTPPHAEEMLEKGRKLLSEIRKQSR